VRRRRLRLISAAIVVLAVAGLAGSAAEMKRAPAATAGVQWAACPAPSPGRDPRQQCATVEVPLDYRNPRGRSIQIAVSRIPAKSGSRRGVMMTNPGGPGVPGVELPSLLQGLFPPGVLDQYDVMGMDPRGVGQSSPISCGSSDDAPLDLLLPYPAPNGSIARNIDFAWHFAAGCAIFSGEILPYITTANTARDMEVIRDALDEPKVSFFGGSYGTYLGAVYATLYPQRTDRMVFDSAIDLRRGWRDFYRSWGSSNDLRMPDFIRWVATRHATYQLGTSPQAVGRAYDSITARLDRTPAKLPDGSRVHGNVLREFTRLQLTNDANFPVLAAAWVYLATGKGTPPVLPRFPDNYVSALNAVSCNDTDWPRDPAIYARQVAVDRIQSPVTAGMPANIRPCAFWPSRPIEPPVEISSRGPRNVLILQNTRDPSTSWVNGRGLRQSLGDRAVLVTVNAGGHIALGRGTCADTAAAGFLTNGELPVRDMYCHGPSPR
jgi:pimeloyl-ACP methyl ester carboxylesterase